MELRDNGPFLEALGRRVRERRQELRLSLDALAARIDFSKTGLWQIETGRSEPRAGTLWRLSLALRVTTDWLIKGE